MRALKVLAASIRDIGFEATFSQLPLILCSPRAIRRLKRRKLRELSEDGFDAAHGTDTARVLIGRELGPGVTLGGHLVVYYATAGEASIRRALDGLALDLSRFVFVDLGCGKGKPLMVAASYPFRRLVGVDISAACVEVARRNIVRFGPDPIDPSRVEFLVQDAADFEFPEEPLLLYLYNPFPAAVLERVVARLERSLAERPRPAVIVYMNPQVAAVIERSGLFERAPQGDEDAGAAQDAGIPAYERAVVYATPGAIPHAT